MVYGPPKASAVNRQKQASSPEYFSQHTYFPVAGLFTMWGRSMRRDGWSILASSPVSGSIR